MVELTDYARDFGYRQDAIGNLITTLLRSGIEDGEIATINDGNREHRFIPGTDRNESRTIPPLHERVTTDPFIPNEAQYIPSIEEAAALVTAIEQMQTQRYESGPSNPLNRVLPTTLVTTLPPGSLPESSNNLSWRIRSVGISQREYGRMYLGEFNADASDHVVGRDPNVNPVAVPNNIAARSTQWTREWVPSFNIGDLNFATHIEPSAEPNQEDNRHAIDGFFRTFSPNERLDKDVEHHINDHAETDEPPAGWIDPITDEMPEEIALAKL